MFSLDRHSRRDVDSSEQEGDVTMSLCAFNSAANIATLIGIIITGNRLFLGVCFSL